MGLDSFSVTSRKGLPGVGATLLAYPLALVAGRGIGIHLSPGTGQSASRPRLGCGNHLRSHTCDEADVLNFHLLDIAVPQNLLPACWERGKGLSHLHTGLRGSTRICEAMDGRVEVGSKGSRGFVTSSNIVEDLRPGLFIELFCFTGARLDCSETEGTVSAPEFLEGSQGSSAGVPNKLGVGCFHQITIRVAANSSIVQILMISHVRIPHWCSLLYPYVNKK